MRLLHSIHSVNPNGGGPIEGVLQLARVHAQNGREIEIVCLDAPTEPWLKNFPVMVHALGPVRSNYGYTPKLKPWLLANASRFDVIIIEGIWQYHSFAVWRACAGKTPYYVFPHGMLDPWFKKAYPLKHLKKWFYWPWAEYRVLRDAHAVFFTAEEERRLARESFWLYKCRERVVGYGTNPPPPEADVQKRAFLEAHPALDGKRVLLFLSRIHPKKGCNLLLQAFSQFAKNDASLHLVMAGPDSVHWSTELKKMAAELGIDQRITWTGMLGGDLKWGAFRAADVFILPSHQENFGVVVAEAVACGTPVLITDKVNIWREIAAANAGFVAPDDLPGIALLLERWLALPMTDQQAMRSNALRCFDEQFNARTVAEKLWTELQPNPTR